MLTSVEKWFAYDETSTLWAVLPSPKGAARDGDRMRVEARRIVVRVLS